jgi:hypothetical protein
MGIESEKLAQTANTAISIFGWLVIIFIAGFMGVMYLGYIALTDPDALLWLDEIPMYWNNFINYFK